ncbi:hypothetical protein EAH87_04085 [Sphingomonas koreensis]|nr:hypothetical protein EAH87_04085 [Sphingomonas koreensis]
MIPAGLFVVRCGDGDGNIAKAGFTAIRASLRLAMLGKNTVFQALVRFSTHFRGRRRVNRFISEI